MLRFTLESQQAPSATDVDAPRRLVMRPWPRRVLGGILCMLSLASTPALAGPPGPIELTAMERAWLAAHPVIRMGVDPDFAPYAFIDAQGRAAGVSAELTSLVAERLGVRLEPVPGLTWPQMLQAARNREIDVITTATYRPERLEYLAFTRPYLITPLVVMTRADAPRLTGLRQLNGMKVALVKDYASTRSALERFPGIDAHIVPNPLAGLNAVSNGQAAAYIGVLGINTYLASRNGISNLKVNTGFDMANSQSYGVRKDWPQLVPLLEKALDSIPEAQQQAIFARWISVSVESIGAPTGVREAAIRGRIAALPELRVGVLQARAPFDSVDKQGTHTGLAADVLEWLVNNTGLKATVVPEASMEKLLALFVAGNLDLVLAVNDAAPGAPVRALSEPYFVSALGVFARQGEVFLGELGGLLDRRVAVRAGGYAQELLRAYPRIALQEYASLTTAAQAVLERRADYLVAESTSALRTIEESGIAGLRYAGSLAEAPVVLRMAVSPERAGLRALINEALAMMPQSDAAEIRRRWVAVPVESGIGWRVAGAGALFFIVTIVLMAVWRYRSTARAHRALKAAQDEQDRAEARSRTIFETASVSLWEEDITEVRRLIETRRAAAAGAWPAYLEVHPDFVEACARAVRIVDVNPATLELYDAASREELLNSIDRVFAGDSYAVFRDELVAIAEGRREFSGEAVNQTLTGRTINVIISLTIPPPGSPSQSMVVVILDITDRKQAELERERLVRDLERRTTELEGFVYTISHDLKAPLISIAGFAQLLGRDVERGDAAMIRDSIGEIRKAAAGMQKLIEDLLNLARTGQIVGERRDVDLEELLGEVQSRCAHHIESEHAEIRIHGPLPRLHADRERLGQVFQNLLDNAVKYHRSGAHPVIDIGAELQPEEVLLYVRDNGKGIPERYRERIFGLFERLDAATEGAGVGLTIVKRIIEQHGGRIWVESQPGAGSTFWISFPRSAMVGAEEGETSGRAK